jgi:hypothetical protein
LVVADGEADEFGEIGNAGADIGRVSAGRRYGSIRGLIGHS